MKETIEYYYNLKIDNLLMQNGNYYFTINSSDYYFVEYLRTVKELEDIVLCYNELKQNNIVVHDLIYNIKNEFLTDIEGKKYILLKINKKNEKFDIIDLIDFNKKISLSSKKRELYRNNWESLWSSKIDYIESQLNEIKIDSIIHSSIDYYIGLSETAIQYVNIINSRYKISENDKITLSHKRIYYPNFGINYLNPLSFIFDLEVRDIAEYLKSTFFAGDDALLELDTYLKSTKLTIFSYNMLYARLLYPTYYLDMYEKIVNSNEDSEKLIPIIKKSEDYTEFLKKAYDKISTYAPLIEIDYLI